MTDRKQRIFSKPVVVGILDSLAETAHIIAKESGFYDDYERVSNALFESAPEADNVLFYRAQKWFESTVEQASIARMHSELSEWLEAVRKPTRPDERCKQFTSQEIEAADIIIRVLDTCGHKGYRIGEALLSKMKYNRTRSYKHGKNS